VRLADRETYAPEASPKLTIEVQEAQVQTGRYRDRHAGRRNPVRIVHCGPVWRLSRRLGYTLAETKFENYNVF